jgi:hypothetical protein
MLTGQQVSRARPLAVRTERLADLLAFPATLGQLLHPLFGSICNVEVNFRVPHRTLQPAFSIADQFYTPEGPEIYELQPSTRGFDTLER